MKYRVGTRESKLAVLQAELVCKKLVEKNKDLSIDQFELIKIKTQGDKILYKNLADIGGKNLFVKEIEEALLDGKIDFAVHSLKDMTAKINPDLIVASTLERCDPRDAFISVKYKNLYDLPDGALIGTSSIRRKYLALSYRPDLLIAPFRGNVLTRLEKLSQNQVDATFLAVSGLKRLKIDKSLYTPLEVSEFLPAVSQGIIGVECLAKDFEMQQLLSSINHLDTYICNQAERGFLESLDADCNSPIAAYAKLAGEKVRLECLVISYNGVQHKESVIGEAQDAWRLGYEMGLKLKAFL
jgi:hydroxymethylbilane synthase